jgi:hypothetical protein
MNITREELLESVFSVGSMQKLYKKSQLGLKVSSESEGVLACNSEMQQGVDGQELGP